MSHVHPLRQGLISTKAPAPQRVDQNELREQRQRQLQYEQVPDKSQRASETRKNSRFGGKGNTRSNSRGNDRQGNNYQKNSKPNHDRGSKSNDDRGSNHKGNLKPKRSQRSNNNFKSRSVNDDSDQDSNPLPNPRGRFMADLRFGDHNNNNNNNNSNSSSLEPNVGPSTILHIKPFGNNRVNNALTNRAEMQIENERKKYIETHQYVIHQPQPEAQTERVLAQRPFRIQQTTKQKLQQQAAQIMAKNSIPETNTNLTLPHIDSNSSTVPMETYLQLQQQLISLQLENLRVSRLVAQQERVIGQKSKTRPAAVDNEDVNVIDFTGDTDDNDDGDDDGNNLNSSMQLKKGTKKQRMNTQKNKTLANKTKETQQEEEEEEDDDDQLVSLSQGGPLYPTTITTKVQQLPNNIDAEVITDPALLASGLNYCPPPASALVSVAMNLLNPSPSQNQVIACLSTRVRSHYRAIDDFFQFQSSPAETNFFQAPLPWNRIKDSNATMLIPFRPFTTIGKSEVATFGERNTARSIANKILTNLTFRTLPPTSERPDLTSIRPLTKTNIYDVFCCILTAPKTLYGLVISASEAYNTKYVEYYTQCREVNISLDHWQIRGPALIIASAKNEQIRDQFVDDDAFGQLELELLSLFEQHHSLWCELATINTLFQYISNTKKSDRQIAQTNSTVITVAEYAPVTALDCV